MLCTPLTSAQLANHSMTCLWMWGWLLLIMANTLSDTGNVGKWFPSLSNSLKSILGRRLCENLKSTYNVYTLSSHNIWEKSVSEALVGWTLVHPSVDTEITPSQVGVTATLPFPLVMFSKSAEDFLLMPPPVHHVFGLWRHSDCAQPLGDTLMETLSHNVLLL